MKQAIQEELNAENLTEFHRTLRDRAVKLVQLSRGKMSQYYDAWDTMYDLYSAYKCKNKEDARRDERGEPKSMRLPVTYAHVETFKTFCMTVFTQRERLFELEATGYEDQSVIEPLELALEQDVKRNQLNQQISEMLVNTAVFGIGVFKHSFEIEKCWYPQEQEEGAVEVGGMKLGGQKIVRYVEAEKFRGNVVRNLSPFKFFPDCRVPIADFQSGEFCASEFEISKMELQKMEAAGQVYGIKYVQHFPEAACAHRAETHSRLDSIKIYDRETTKNMVCVTEVQLKLIPKDVKLDGDKPLGEESFPVRYLLWLANDHRVIRCEPLAYLHDQFTYDVSLYGKNTHEFIPQGLVELTKPLQETIDWFIESRVSAVTRTIDNQLIVDPLGVNMDSLKNRSRIITLKKGAARTGVDRYIKQLQVHDSTTGHMSDASNFIELTRMTTGINENALGQYHKGRRSATEARVVSKGAAARQLAIADSIWSSCLEPLGLKMLTNIRQGYTEEYYLRTIGASYKGQWAKFKSDPLSLITGADHFVFDGTMPSEKDYLAQTLQELLGLVMNNPEAMAQFDMSPRLIIRKIFDLRGVKLMDDFSLQNDDNQLQQLLQQAMQQGFMAAQQQLMQQPNVQQPPVQ